MNRLFAIHFVRKMTDQVYSRAYLQGLYLEKQKKEYLTSIIRTFIYDVKIAASSGKTSYFFQIPDANLNGENSGLISITKEDYISSLKATFPDCDISYEEVLVRLTPTSQVLRKGFRIDWSREDNHTVVISA